MKQKKDLKEINVLCSREKSPRGPLKRQTKNGSKSEKANNKVNCRILTNDLETKENSAFCEKETICTEDCTETRVSGSGTGENITIEVVSDEIQKETKLIFIPSQESPDSINDINDQINEDSTTSNDVNETQQALDQTTESETATNTEQCHNGDIDIETITLANSGDLVDTTMTKFKQCDLKPITEETEELAKQKEVLNLDLSEDLDHRQSPAKTNRKQSKSRSANKSDKRRASCEERTKKYDAMFDKRPYSAADTSKFKSCGHTSPSPRRSLSDPFRITKTELEWYLPRKSNFDCHDKALKDAGQISQEKMDKLERRKEKIMEKLRREKEARLKAKQATMEVKPEEQAKVDENRINFSSKPYSESSVFDTNEEEDEFLEEENVVTAIELTSSSKKQASTSSMLKKKGKRRGHHDDDEDTVRVDYQPLLLYLKYVQQNPEEFESHRKSSVQLQYQGQKASQRTEVMAQIMERKNRSAISSYESVVVQAAKDIRPRITDPGQWTVASKERNLMNNINSMNSRKEPSYPNPKQENQDSNQNAEEPKTEFEKEKAKLDKWLKTVSTAQLNKGKELALKELGEEDRYLTKWWSALQTCSYIRRKGSYTEQ